jgi:hypothetical protein
MKKNKITIFSIMVILLLLTVHCSGILSESTLKKNDVKLILKNSDGRALKSINKSSDEIILMMNNMKTLLNKLENNTISEKDFLESLLVLFMNEDIIPKTCTFNNLKEIGSAFSQNIDQDNFFDFNNLNYFNLFNDSMGIPIHLGRSTIIGSISFGNYLVKRVIPFGKYGFYEVFSKNILLDYNLSSDFTYASACLWTPGPHGNHVLYSFMHYPGLQKLSHKVFIDKAIGGLFVIGANISLEAFSTENDQVLFDATIGVYGSDMMFGFK